MAPRGLTDLLADSFSSLGDDASFRMVNDYHQGVSSGGFATNS